MPSPSPSVLDLFGLESQRYLVCGAGNGIGAACSRALAGLGAEVLCVDRDPDLAEAIAEEVGGTWLAADLITEEGVAALVEAAGDRVDGLVDIIGEGSRCTIDDLEPAIWDKDFDVNLRHAYLLGRAFAPRMAIRDSGSLIFITSVVTRFGTHVTPAYHASKAALLSWVRSLAVSYGHRGVRANSVSPGVIRTPRMMAHFGRSNVSVADVIKTNAMKVIATPDDVAGCVAFLASPAARMVTGQTITVDGGTIVRDPFYGDPIDETLI